MIAPPSNDLTTLLNQSFQGDQAAAEELFPLIYNELRRLARNQLRKESPGHTLNTRALVHEAYLRLFKPPTDNWEEQWQDRAHFFGVAARQMRQILIDYARAKSADKRGGGLTRVDLDAVSLPVPPTQGVDLIALDLALKKLETLHPRTAQIIEMRFFAGLTEEETAEALELSRATVRREVAFGRAWLFDEIDAG
jgi:RNA polymerase sigma factor (TIGR02999 family)